MFWLYFSHLFILIFGIVFYQLRNLFINCNNPLLFLFLNEIGGRNISIQPINKTNTKQRLQNMSSNMSRSLQMSWGILVQNLSLNNFLDDVPVAELKVNYIFGNYVISRLIQRIYFLKFNFGSMIN